MKPASQRRPTPGRTLALTLWGVLSAAQAAAQTPDSAATLNAGGAESAPPLADPRSFVDEQQLLAVLKKNMAQAMQAYREHVHVHPRMDTTGWQKIEQRYLLEIAANGTRLAQDKEMTRWLWQHSPASKLHVDALTSTPTQQAQGAMFDPLDARIVHGNLREQVQTLWRMWREFMAVFNAHTHRADSYLPMSQGPWVPNLRARPQHLPVWPVDPNTVRVNSESLAPLP